MGYDSHISGQGQCHIHVKFFLGRQRSKSYGSNSGKGLRDMEPGCDVMGEETLKLTCTQKWKFRVCGQLIAKTRRACRLSVFWIPSLEKHNGCLST